MDNRAGATVLAIEHDLDVIARADHVVDLGRAGGRIVATGTPEQIAAHPDSVTGRWLTLAPSGFGDADAEAVAGGDFGDAGAHEATADDAETGDGFHLRSYLYGNARVAAGG